MIWGRTSNAGRTAANGATGLPPGRLVPGDDGRAAAGRPRRAGAVGPTLSRSAPDRRGARGGPRDPRTQVGPRNRGQAGTLRFPNLDQPYMLLARMYLASGRSSEAIEQLNASLLENPTNVAALSLLGTIHSSAGAHELARDAYQRALLVNSNAPLPLNNLACLLSHSPSTRRTTSRATRPLRRGWRCSTPTPASRTRRWRR